MNGIILLLHSICLIKHSIFYTNKRYIITITYYRAVLAVSNFIFVCTEALTTTTTKQQLYDGRRAEKHNTTK